MRQVLFTIPLLGWQIYSYGLMLAAGALIGLQASIRLARRRGLDEQMIIDVTMVSVLSGIVGARIFFVIQFYGRHFADRPFIDVFKVWQGGLVFYGGVIVAATAVILFALKKKLTREQIWDLADCAAVGVVLGLAFGRVGCLLNGCCFGRPTDSWLGITFPRGCPVHWHHVSGKLIAADSTRSLAVLPTQPISSLTALAIFAVLYFVVARRARLKGAVAHWALVLYPVGRFSIEILRDEPALWGGALGSVSAGQWVSIVVLAVNVPAFIVRWRLSRSGPPDGNGGGAP